MRTFAHARGNTPPVNCAELYARIERLIHQRDLDAARAEVSRLEPTTPAEHRLKAHAGAIIRFYEGRIADAAVSLARAVDAYGDNVNLRRDLMICQYHLQDLDGFRRSLNTLEVALIEHETRLNSRSLIAGEVWLGKFMEEEARLATAYALYARALARQGDPDRHLFAMIQMARWQALYEAGDNLSALYRELISVPPARVTKNLYAELEHSLMLIELRLIGGDHAWARVERTEQTLLALDRRLLIFDYLEGALAQDLTPHPAAVARLRTFHDLDPYEDFLRELVTQSPSHERKIRELGRIAPGLTWSSHLRLLCLTANLEQNAPARAELDRKIQLILGDLDPRSQDLWRRRLKQSLGPPEVRVNLSLRARTIAVDGQILDLSKKKIGLQLLTGLLAKPELSVDDAIDMLWQSSFTPEHYHRLRMSTHRLNTLIHDGTGVGKLIEVDSQMVRLRPEVRLTSVDAPA